MAQADVRSSTHTNTPSDSTLWSVPRLHGHSVQFYEDDSFLLGKLSQFIGSALGAGDSVLVIASKSHRDGLSAILRNRGFDLSIPVREGRFLAVDSAATLAKFMVGETPDPVQFMLTISELIAKLAPARDGEPRRVAVYGDMVAILATEGSFDAAIQLEGLWNECAYTHSFQLHCAYPLGLFSNEQDGEKLRQICAEHLHVVPAEQSFLLTHQERDLELVLLQQKAKALATEVQERKKIQRVLEEREAELSDFMDNAMVGMHWVAADGKILWANRAELTLLGYNEGEYFGRHIADFHADAAVIEDILERLGRYEELHGYEASLRCKDGTLRHVRIDSNVLVRDGKFVHTRCFTSDITEKRRSEEAMFRLAAIVESSNDAIISKDLNGMITSWNESARLIFGYEPEEIIGQPILRLIPPGSIGEAEVVLRKIRAGERLEHLQTVRHTKTGNAINVSLTVSPIHNRHGEVIGAAEIVRDITQQKKMEATLHTNERLASAGRLAATVAHEINNPLETVTNLIYIAKLHPDTPEEVRQSLDTADEELRRIAHITQQTLGFYRNDSQPTSLPLSVVIDEVLAVYDRKRHYKNLSIEKRVDPNLMLETVQGELKQILSNLIANAIDASREGGKIMIRARSSCHHPSHRRGVRITIADNGTGISKQNKDKVFAPFFTTKPVTGTGLGLWITRDLLHKRGGHIQVRSMDSEPTGTVMSIFLISTGK